MRLCDQRFARGAIALLAMSTALAAPAAATAAGGVTERVSVSSSGSQANDRSGADGRPAISDDGDLVAFDSTATNLVPGATSGHDNIYLRHRANGATELVSVTPNGTEPNGESSEPDISADGRYVAFETAATNLIRGGPAAEVVVYDRVTRTTTPVSVVGKTGAAGQNPSISDDGRYVAFQSNNVAGTINGTSDVFVHDLQTGSTVLVSVDSARNPADRGDASDPSISSDGRYIAFDAAAQTLVPGDTNSAEDVFVHDMLTGQTTRVNVDSAGNQTDGDDLHLAGPQISADGRYVTFESAATNLVAGDTNTCTFGVHDFAAAGQCPDVFVHDLQTGTTTRVSVDSNGNQADGWSSDPAIDADGSAVAFLSAATNLVPGDANTCGTYTDPGECPDVFVHAG